MTTIIAFLSAHWGTIAAIATVLADGYLAGNPNSPYAGILRTILGQSTPGSKP